MKQYEPLQDPILLTHYCRGNDDIPFFWVRGRYERPLYFVAYYRVHDEDNAAEVLYKVIDELHGTEPTQRSRKIRLVNDKAEVSLLRVTKLRAIDFFRRNKRISYDERELQGKMEELSDRGFLAQLEAKDQVGQLGRRLEEKYGSEERMMMELVMQYPGALKPIAESLAIDANTARMLKQRMIRRARRILLNLNRIN